ncbi:MAG: hypothetical protein PHQ20_04230 [Candidatus Moranbacteria bacterium]|nr:hypothetical protein [Candidatus Moranbacteria bacterium]
MLGKKVEYSSLNSKQKEIYNFQKVSAVFADYGYTTIKLSDDWMGADFIAISPNGLKHLRIQLKTRLTFDKRYQKKDLCICFYDAESGNWYMYDHDEMLKKFIKKIKNSKAWKAKGGFHYPSLSQFAVKCLESSII